MLVCVKGCVAWTVEGPAVRTLLRLSRTGIGKAKIKSAAVERNRVLEARSQHCLGHVMLARQRSVLLSRC